MAKKIKPPRDKEAEKKAEEEAKAAEEKSKQEEAEKLAASAQDEFQARGFELVEWVQENRPVVLGFIGIVIASGLAFGIYTVVDRSDNTKASIAYAAAEKLIDAPIGDDTDPDDNVPAFKTEAERTQAAKAAFEKITKENKRTGAAVLAALSLGHLQLKLGENEAAAASYTTFLKGSAPKDPLRFAGYGGLALAKEALGDTKAAIAALEEGVSMPDKTDEDAMLLSLGRLYAAGGDADKARARLERLKTDFPDSSLRARADELLATLPKKEEKKAEEKKPDEKKPEEPKKEEEK